MRNPTNRAIRFSRQAFHFLMKAYPQAHRQNFGAEMEQVFRDQCHDAWQAECSWGLFKLWLRILPDLIKTSVMEHVESMKGRKSMLEKTSALTNGSRSTAVFIRVFAVIFLLVVTTSVLITYLLPETFASTARINLQPADALKSGTSYDPYLIQTEFEVIQSEPILGTVIEKLKLNELWGKKYMGGQVLKNAESIQLLRKSLHLIPIRNTSLLQVEVFSDQPKEAATIANCIAETYAESRRKSPNDLVEQSPRSLVTDKAEPNSIPVRPKKALNITLGCVFGIVLGAAAGVLVIAIRMAFSKKRAAIG